MSQTAALPPLSSLPLQVVHNLPHLLAGSNNAGNANSNTSNSNLNVACNNNLLRSNMQHQQQQQQQQQQRAIKSFFRF